jgi:hypothetical protein
MSKTSNPGDALDGLEAIRRLVEELAADRRMASQTRMLASAIEATIENLLEIFKSATMGWPRQVPK